MYHWVRLFVHWVHCKTRAFVKKAFYGNEEGEDAHLF